jgi:hypothetical protein
MEENIMSELKKDSKQIKEFATKRGIKYLCHFTSIFNVYNILKHGILPIDEMNKQSIRFFYSDRNRYDNKTSCVSLTISDFNHQYITKLMHKPTKPILAYILIDFKLLTEADNEAYFCITNASNSSIVQEKGFDGFKEMFDEKLIYYVKNNRRNSTEYEVDRQGRKFNETTDDQAEALFEGNIDRKYIKKIILLEHDYNILKNKPFDRNGVIKIVKNHKELMQQVTNG